MGAKASAPVSLNFVNNLGVPCSATGTTILPSTPLVTLTLFDVQTNPTQPPNWTPSFTIVSSNGINTYENVPNMLLSATSAIGVTIGVQQGDPTNASASFYVPAGFINWTPGPTFPTFTLEYPLGSAPKLATLTGTLRPDKGLFNLELTGFGIWAPTSQAPCATTSPGYANFIPLSIDNATANQVTTVSVTQTVPVTPQPVFSSTNQFTLQPPTPPYTYSFVVSPGSSAKFSWPPTANLMVQVGASAALPWTFAQISALSTTAPQPLLFNTAGISSASGLLTVETYPVNALAVQLRIADTNVVNVHANIRAYFVVDTKSPVTSSSYEGSSSNSSKCPADRPADSSSSPCNAGLDAHLYSSYKCDVPSTYTASGLQYPDFYVSVTQAQNGVATQTLPAKPTRYPFSAPFSTTDYGQCMYVASVSVTFAGSPSISALTVPFPLKQTSTPIPLNDASNKTWAVACVDDQLTIHVNEYVPVGKADGLLMDPFNVEAMMNVPVYATSPNKFTPGVPFQITTAPGTAPGDYASFIAQYSIGRTFTSFYINGLNANLYYLKSDGEYSVTNVLQTPPDWSNSNAEGGVCCSSLSDDENYPAVPVVPTVRTLNGYRESWAETADPFSTNSFFTFDVITNSGTPFLALRSLTTGYQGFLQMQIASVAGIGAYLTTDTSGCSNPASFMRWAFALSENSRTASDICLLVSGPVSGLTPYYSKNIYQVMSTSVFYYDQPESGNGVLNADFLLSLYLNGDGTGTAPVNPAVTVQRLWLPYGPLIAFRNNWQANGGDVSTAVCECTLTDYGNCTDAAGLNVNCNALRPLFPSYLNSAAEMFPFRSMFNLNVVNMGAVGPQSYSDGCNTQPTFASTCLTIVNNAPPGTCKNNVSTCTVADTVLGSTLSCVDTVDWATDISALTLFATNTCIAQFNSSDGYACAGIAGDPAKTCTGFTSSNFGDICSKICSDTNAKVNGGWLPNSTCDALKNNYCGEPSNFNSGDCSCINFQTSSYATSAVKPLLPYASSFQAFYSAFQQNVPIVLEFQDEFWPPCTASDHGLRLNSQVNGWTTAAANCFASLYDSHIDGKTLTWDAINDCVAKQSQSSSSGSSGNNGSNGSNGAGGGAGSSGGLPAWAIALIVVAGVVLIVGLAVLGVVLHRKKTSKTKMS